ncbi:MAG: nucleoside recognition domain-containing protein [Peptococcaceae bacterium]
MDYKRIIKLGLKDGVETTWELGKVLIPVYFMITLLKHTAVIDWLVRFVQPLTSLVGLHGEAALPIVIANALTLYPAIPAITSFPFSQKEITIIGTMVLLCHSLPVETVIARKSGSKGMHILGVRIIAAIAAAIFLNLVMEG